MLFLLLQLPQLISYICSNPNWSTSDSAPCNGGCKVLGSLYQYGRPGKNFSQALAMTVTCGVNQWMEHLSLSLHLSVIKILQKKKKKKKRKNKYAQHCWISLWPFHAKCMWQSNCKLLIQIVIAAGSELGWLSSNWYVPILTDTCPSFNPLWTEEIKFKNKMIT